MSSVKDFFSQGAGQITDFFGGVSSGVSGVYNDVKDLAHGVISLPKDIISQLELPLIIIGVIVLITQLRK